MDVEEIIKGLRSIKNDELQNVIDSAIEIIEKEIPKKPIQPKELTRWGMGECYHDYGCPKCKSFIAPEPKGNSLMRENILSRCSYCGQILKWAND